MRAQDCGVYYRTRIAHRSFARRSARGLSARRVRLLATALQPITLVPNESYFGHPKFFKHFSELRLEIGFGAGEHLLAQALAAPHIGFIGCEPYMNGVASLLAKMYTMSKLDNLLIFPSDALLLLDKLSAESFKVIYLLFPDPWHKRRHRRRRLLRSGVLDIFARLLCKEGLLRWASDEPSFVASSLASCCAHPCFRWSANSPADWQLAPSGWCETRYERKAREQGREVCYADFLRY